jgi:hypothetical protein
MKKIQKVDKLKEFLKDNNIEFTKGRRNTDSTIIAGFCLWLDLNDMEAIVKTIKAVCPDPHWNFAEEFERVYAWAERNGYGSWWDDKVAHSHYKF